MTQERWQLYDEQGRPLSGQGATKEQVYQGLLHGAAHVWLWRISDGALEVLLQKRADSKRTWPGKYDISAAGHIDFGEDPVTAALRETHEEIGIEALDTELEFIGAERERLVAPDGSIENELRWIYLLELTEDKEFALRDQEVTSVVWKPLAAFRAEVLADPPERYVPHGSTYFETVISVLESKATTER